MTGPQPPAQPDLLAVCEVCLQWIGDGDGAVWYDTYREMEIANGVAPDDPVLAPCRDSRPYIDAGSVSSRAPGAVITADQAAATVSRVGRLIREFIVESAGMDVGEAMTADANLLAGRLSATGHLEIRRHPRSTGSTSALEMIRQFIVECVSDDLGDDTIDLADQLRGHLAAAGVLAGCARSSRSRCSPGRRRASAVQGVGGRLDNPAGDRTGSAVWPDDSALG